MGDSPSVLVRLRLSARDRALLEQLVEHERRELEHLGVEVSLSSVMRKLIRAAAKASAIDVAGDELPRRAAPASAPPSTTPAPSQDQVRALLRKKMAERRGLGAELARKLGVERAQVSRFKAGNESSPAGKLAGLYALLAGPETCACGILLSAWTRASNFGFRSFVKPRSKSSSSRSRRTGGRRASLAKWRPTAVTSSLRRSGAA
jgi:transcriptional regulator with XRE-family HTH domain